MSKKPLLKKITKEDKANVMGGLSLALPTEKMDLCEAKCQKYCVDAKYGKFVSNENSMYGANSQYHN